MELKEYNDFLKGRLQETLKPLENNILSLLSQNSDEHYRSLYRRVGNRDMLTEILSKLDALLEDFYKRNEA